jgi:hypothetical protein
LSEARRLDRIERALAARLLAAPLLTPEERVEKIVRLLEEADRPGASPDVRARAARVREILERAEARAREQERGY